MQEVDYSAPVGEAPASEGFRSCFPSVFGFQLVPAVIPIVDQHPRRSVPPNALAPGWVFVLAEVIRIRVIRDRESALPYPNLSLIQPSQFEIDACLVGFDRVQDKDRVLA